MRSITSDNTAYMRRIADFSEAEKICDTWFCAAWASQNTLQRLALGRGQLQRHITRYVICNFC